MEKAASVNMPRHSIATSMTTARLRRKIFFDGVGVAAGGCFKGLRYGLLVRLTMGLSILHTRSSQSELRKFGPEHPDSASVEAHFEAQMLKPIEGILGFSLIPRTDRQMPQQELPAGVIRVLGTLEIEYMVTGSIVSSIQGEPRLTHDIDLVVIPDRSDARKLVELFPSERFNLDEESIMKAIEQRGTFNLIDA